MFSVQVFDMGLSYCSNYLFLVGGAKDSRNYRDCVKAWP